MSSIFLSSLDCFTNDNGVFGARESIQFNRYAQNDNDEVITIGLCENELQTGWDCLAYDGMPQIGDSTTRRVDL